MQDTVRSNWAAIYSNDKKEVLNTINAYLDLNVEVNEAYNYIVNERSNYLMDNKLEEGQPIDHFILDELFLSYTIFLDSYSQLGFYYVLCSCFPVHQMAYFVQNRQMREASLILGDRDE